MAVSDGFNPHTLPPNDDNTSPGLLRLGDLFFFTLLLRMLLLSGLLFCNSLPELP